MGRGLYLAHTGQVLEKVFAPLFSGLDSLSDEALKTVTEALNRFNRTENIPEKKLMPVRREEIV